MITIRNILALSAMFASAHHFAHGAGLNTDVALTPPQGGTIARVQWRYSELSSDPTPADRDVRRNVFPLTVVHGLTSEFAVLATLPTVHRSVQMSGADGKLRDTGFADIPILAKYRFFQDDQPGRTTRWAVVGGAELPSFDSTFSSDSVDPIIGTVWTHQRLDWWIDWSLIYQFNTGSGLDGDDEARADVAGSYPLATGQQKAFGPWGLYAIGEINAYFFTDGGAQAFLSPGLQFIAKQWILEAGVQLPIHQDMKTPRLETDLTTVMSFRYQF